MLLLILIASYVLSDLYYDIGRVYDYIVIAYLLFKLLFAKKLPYDEWALGIKFIVLLAFWLLLAFFKGQVFLAGAIIIGLLVVFPGTVVVLKCMPMLSISRSVSVALVVAMAFFFVQFLYFQFFSFYLNFGEYLGSLSGRGYNGYGLFRAHGITQEPNAYCLSIIALLFIYSKCPSRNYYIVLGSFVSIFLSLSLWGVLIAPMIYFLLFRADLSVRNLIRVLTAVLVGLSILEWDFVSSLFDTGITQRLDALTIDESRYSRYGGFMGLLDVSTFLVGYGLNSDVFQNYGANGLIFIFHSIGLLGVLFWSFILLYYWKIRRVFFLKDLIVLGLIFTTYPSAGYMYLYILLGFIYYFNKKVCVEYSEA